MKHLPLILKIMQITYSLTYSIKLKQKKLRL